MKLQTFTSQPVNAALNHPMVLVIDDEEESGELVGILLPPFGYNVIVAKNGNAGIAMALEKLPDLIVMDLAMPIKDGLDTAKEIKAIPQLAHIPIIALTGVTNAAEKAIDAGMSACLEKPIDRFQLASMIAKYIDKQK